MTLFITLLFLLQLVAVSKCLPVRACPGGSIKANFCHQDATCKCYKVFPLSEGWYYADMAKDACTQEGWMPTSIHSVVENDFVTRLALNAVFADIPGPLDAESSKWSYLAAIGGLSDQKEWSDGSRFQYSNFGHQLDIMGSPRT
ncbi:hypothetical protein AAVH_14765 [Aphelenchoides avenae]|nr:hypothetical protein AAVH_14765 [Aphelenchus avenae]